MIEVNSDGKRLIRWVSGGPQGAMRLNCNVNELVDDVRAHKLDFEKAYEL